MLDKLGAEVKATIIQSLGAAGSEFIETYDLDKIIQFAIILANKMVGVKGFPRDMADLYGWSIDIVVNSLVEKNRKQLLVNNRKSIITPEGKVGDV